MYVCQKCGTSHGSSFCPNCGAPAQNSEQQAAFNPNHEPQQKKNSGMSIAALVLSILGCTLWLGLIFAIIDLAGSKKHPESKHGLSKGAIGVCIAWFFLSIVLSIASGSASQSETKMTISESEVQLETAESDSSEEIHTEEAMPEVEKNEDSNANETMGQKNALQKAKAYLSVSAFSYNGLVKQLEYEGFTPEEAAYGADNCNADWNEQALKKAQAYLDFSAFSYSGLADQLIYDGFSEEEAAYGVDNCGADWNEQAAKKAEDYLEFSSFSREGLIEQLEFEGFTQEQAEYGATAIGY